MNFLQRTLAHRTLATTAIVVGLVQLACVPAEMEVDFDPPPESTYVTRTVRWQAEHRSTLGVPAAMVTADFFELAGAPPFLGRTFLPADFEVGAEPVVVLAHRLWKSRLESNPEAVGREIVVDGRGYKVLAVMPPGVEWPPGAELWLPKAPRSP